MERTPGVLFVFFLILIWFEGSLCSFRGSFTGHRRGVHVLNLERRLKQHSHDEKHISRSSDKKPSGRFTKTEQHKLRQNGKEFSLKVFNKLIYLIFIYIIL